MKNLLTTLELQTKKQFEIVDITEKISEIIAKSGIHNGICAVFSPHTTASIRLNHNEPLLVQDIMKALYRLAPVDVSYGHDLFEVRQTVAPNERSNGHAHVKTFILGSSETIIVSEGKLLIGEKQSIFFVDFDGGRSRQVHIQILGS